MNTPIEMAGGVIRNIDGDILLLHRHAEGQEQWELPGGKVELGESPERAMRRELKEELGVEVRLARYLGKTSFRQNDTNRLYSWYETEIEGSPRVMETHIHDEFAYFRACRLWALQPLLSENLRAFVEQMSEGEIRLDAC